MKCLVFFQHPLYISCSFVSLSPIASFCHMYLLFLLYLSVLYLLVSNSYLCISILQLLSLYLYSPTPISILQLLSLYLYSPTSISVYLFSNSYLCTSILQLIYLCISILQLPYIYISILQLLSLYLYSSKLYQYLK